MRERNQDRRQRIPWGQNKKNLNLDPETEKNLKARKLKPRWVNDDKNGQRVQERISRGYDFVCAQGTELIGDRKEAEQKGTLMCKRVGENKDGSAQMAYLMATPEKYFIEDKELKEAENMKVDEAIRGGKPKGLKYLDVKREHGRAEVKTIEYTP